MNLLIDLETFCTVPISHGTHAYAASAEVMLTAYAIDDGPVSVVEGMPPDLQDMIDAAENVVMHADSDFDRVVLGYQDVVIPHEKVWNTAVQALSHGLPAGLDALCKIMGVDADMAKLASGKKLIQLFCKPRPVNAKLDRATKFTHPEQWAEFVNYAGQDVVAMRELKRRLPNINYPGNKRERELYCLDLRMNDLGIAVDAELARAAIDTVKVAKKAMDARTQEMTDDQLRSTTQRDQLLEMVLREYGVALPDMQASTLERRLADPDLPAGARELLAMRLQTSTTSNAKYNRLLKAVSADGRLRGAVQFSGAARTKRWSGRVFQPQNLPRPDMPAEDIELGIECIKAGSAHLVFDEPIKLASNAIRGVIVAPAGKKLVVSDLAQVEARVLPWLAGEQWKLKAFREYDYGRAPDNYVMAYARGFGVDPAAVGKDGRQIGKVSELSCFGPHTRVLTSNGVKPITEVATGDRLWDGVEWADHEGLVSRGWRRVINLCGLDVTPDHRILSGDHWVEAQTVACTPNTLQSVLATGSANLPSPASSMEPKEGSIRSRFNVLVARSRTLFTATTSARVPAPAAIPAPRRHRATTLKNTTAMPTSAPTTSTAAACSLGSQRASPVAVPAVTPPMVGGAFACSNIGALAPMGGVRFSNILSRLKAGISRSWSWIAKTPTAITPPATYASSPRSETNRRDALSEFCSSRLTSWSDVYDIAHVGPRNRFTVLTDAGPMVVHNCGYGGSKGAWKAMGELYGFDLPDAQVMNIVRKWREAHPAICDWDTGFWKQLDDAARQAIANKGKTFEAGKHIRFERWREWLRMELPSGTFLNYAAPAIIDDPRRPGTNTVSYLGIDTYTRKWGRLTTYGGKLSADATQATAREIMAENLPRIELMGFLPVLLVHDEVVTETPDTEDYTVTCLNTLLARTPEWAIGLPLAAGGFETYRYRKD